MLNTRLRSLQWRRLGNRCPSSKRQGELLIQGALDRAALQGPGDDLDQVLEHHRNAKGALDDMARKLYGAPEVGGAETTRAYELVPRIGIIDVLPEEGPEPGVTGLALEDADGTDIFSTGPFQLDGQVVVG